jgi:hypothetical protein
MATNNNKPVDMKQMWQQMEPAPVASLALSYLTTSEDGSDRFIYYLTGSYFFRYDSYGNTYQKLAPPLSGPLVAMVLRYSKYSGTFGKVISATASTIRIGGGSEGLYTGYVIRITSGTGAGQVRTITSCPAAMAYDQGANNATPSYLYITDTSKKWKINQWVGYQARLIFGSGQSQIRRIINNSATQITFSDPNYQPIDPFGNVPLTVATAWILGTNTQFVIEATDLTVNTPWTVQPDSTSMFKIESGGIWFFTGYALAPNASLQYYDCSLDLWITKTVPAGFLTTAMTFDITMERTGEVGGIYLSGTATSATTYTLVDTTKTMVRGDYANYRLRVTGGTGVGQSRRIVTNGTNYFELARKWDVTVDATSTYEIIADKDKLYIAGSGLAFMLQYDIDSDLIIQGSKSDDGIANALAARHPGIDSPSYAITSGTLGATGITAVNSAPTVGGTGYVVGDILTVTTGGINGKVLVEATTTSGVVTQVSLFRAGSSYSTGTGKVTSGGTGTGCTINVTTVGSVCNIITPIAHRFKIGDSVILSGDVNYAGTVTIIGCESTLTFDVATSAVGNMTAATAQAATVIVDSTKNWTVGEHIGKLVQTHVAGLTGAVQPRVITANTATTLTVATITTALVNGTGRYIITDLAALGRDDQYKNDAKTGFGWATGGSTTTLIDTAKNWITGCWIGARVRIKAGTGRDSYIIVTSNTSNTLTYPTQSFTPDTTTQYYLQDSYGTATGGATQSIIDTTKVWAVDQWVGKKVRILGGSGFGLLLSNNNEATIQSNTVNTLTFTAAMSGFAPDATTIYTIIGCPSRGAGIELVWAFGGVSQGRHMYIARGSGSNIIDRYNICTEEWDYPLFISPQTDVLAVGTYYAYDGNNRVYFSPGVASGSVQYVYYLDLTTRRVYGLGSVPNTQLAPTIGNRMEILTSPQGIDYLYHMRNTAYEIYRTQLFF